MKYMTMAIGIGMSIASVAFVVAAFVADPNVYARLVPAAILLPVGLLLLGVGADFARSTISEPAFVSRGAGLPVAAEVLEANETGMTITNASSGPDAPILDFHLRIVRDAAAPYELWHTQSVPRAAIGAALPGSTFSVLVDPADAASIYIDWPATLAQRVASPSPSPSPSAGRKVRFRSTGRATDVLAAGDPARATVVSFRRLGSVRSLRIASPDPAILDHSVHRLKLRVEPVAKRAYNVRIAHRVPPEVEPQLREGLEVGVAVDRSKRRRVAINWPTVGQDR